ncbi:ATP-binding protein [Aquabacterium sp.]|uniref:sensor histidine kinase n=1 Tax=Aquabacterium sp. TaxID=1872578 RepID=UPI0025C0970D|nr:ATP-binding protein [Aquabacterium sp.]
MPTQSTHRSLLSWPHLVRRVALPRGKQAWLRVAAVAWWLIACIVGGLAFVQWVAAPPSLVLAETGPVVHPLVPLRLDQVTELDQACVLPDAGRPSPPDAEAPWLHTHLPHRWMDTHPGHQGGMWYRFRVRLPRTPDAVWGVYLPRVVMNGQVWVNGVALGYSGSMSDPVTRNWYQPLLFTVPDKLWQPGENLVYVRVVSGYQSRDGLAPIQVGPIAELAHIHQWRQWLQIDGQRVIHVALITIGLLMILVWLRDRSQAAFGFMGLSAVLWGVSTLMLLSPTPLTTAPTWEVACALTMTWYQLALCTAFYRFGEVRAPGVYLLIGLMAALALPYYLFWSSYVSTCWIFVAVYVLALGGMGRAIWHVLRHRRPDALWFVLGCAMLVPAGWHDVLVVMGRLPFDAIYWLGLMGPGVIVCSFVILVGDYSRSRRALHELNQNLAARVAERELALRESFARLAGLERAQAVSAERSRILKDMHDGVGAHLTSALRQLHPQANQPVDVPLVAQTLRDSLDQLKLSIDAMSLQPGDVVGLLASWRFRLTPRLKAAGLSLIWDVDELPSWPAGQAPFMRQLQYILFEGLSNVLQHSGATTLVLQAKATDDHVVISLIDNGRGWPPDGLARGQGLRTMQGRATHIGAELSFLTPETGGLVLRIALPLRETGEGGLSSAA